MFDENFKHGKTFNVDSYNFAFTDLKTFVQENGHKTLVVNAVFHYKAKYGERPVLVAHNLKINLPDHCLKDVEKILDNQEYIDAINAGKCGFQTTEYIDPNGNVRYSGSFVDI